MLRYLVASLLFAYSITSSLVIHAQKFATATTYDSGVGYTESIATADVNGDGYPDIFNANYFSNTVGVLLSTGSGDFHRIVTYSVGAGSFPRDILVQDINNDNYPDIIVGNEGINKLEVFLGLARGEFQPPVVASPAGFSYTPIALALADINGDTKLDLVTANSNASDNSVSIFINTGNGSFQLSTVLRAANSNASDIEVGDVNGDSKPDIVTVGASSIGSIFLGNGNGLFQPALQYATNSNGGDQLKLGDLNGDNKLDIVFTTSGFSKVAALLGDGNGTFKAATSYSTGVNSYPAGVALNDINQDGKLDIVLPVLNPNAIRIMIGNGNGSFESGVNVLVPSPYYINNLAVTDINRDNRPDIVLSAIYGNSAPYTSAIITVLNAIPLPTRATLSGTNVTLAPNPSSTATTLVTTGLPGNVAKVQAVLLDDIGRTARRQTLAVSQGAAQAELSMTGLVPGLYMVQLLALDATGTVVGALPTQRLSVQ